MNFSLIPLETKDIEIFKNDMQEAFQQGAISAFPELDTEILPKEDIEKSLNTPGAYAYKAVIDGKISGGAIVVINEITNYKV